MARCLGDLLPPSPPGEKATARQDQAGQSGADDGAGNVAHARDSVLETESFSAAHRRSRSAAAII